MTKVFLSRTNHVCSPWLNRSVVSGSARHIRRSRARGDGAISAVGEAEVLHQPLDVAMEREVVAPELLRLPVLLHHHDVEAGRALAVLAERGGLPAVLDGVAKLRQ